MLTYLLNMGSRKIPASKVSGSLSEYVKRVREDKKLSLTDVETRAKTGITSSYVSKIENGQAGQVTLPRLKALARGLGVSFDELVAKAHGSVKPADDEEFRESLYYMLYEKAKTATPEKRELIKSILKMIDRELDDDLSATS